MHSASARLHNLARLAVVLLLGAYLANTWINEPAPLNSMTNADARKYWSIAGTLADRSAYAERKYSLDGTTEFELRAWRPPFTAFFLAPFRALGLTAEQLLYVYWLALAATAALLWSAASEFVQPYFPAVSSTAGAAAAMLYLTHLQTLRASTTLGSEIPFMLLLATTAWLILRGTRPAAGSALRLVVLALAGLACGCALLSRSVTIALVPAFTGLIVARCATGASPKLRAGAAPAAVFVLAFLTVLAGWQFRNALHLDGFVFVASSSGYNFLKGNVEREDPAVSKALLERNSALLAELGEAGASAQHTRDALSYIRAKPNYFVSNTLAKIVQLWAPRQGLRTGSRTWLYVAVTQLALLLAMLAAPLTRPHDLAFWSLASGCVLLTVLHGLTFVGPRFVMPVLFPCYFFATYWVALLLQRWLARGAAA